MLRKNEQRDCLTRTVGSVQGGVADAAEPRVLRWPGTSRVHHQESTMSPPHPTPKCTGVWQRERYDTHVFWRCNTCRALTPASTEMNWAIVRERVLGRELDQLTREGRKLLDRP